jgi:hypothetical protein
MSTEKIIKKKQIRSTSMTSEESRGKTSSRVNINHLIARVKEQEKKENKTNLIYLSLFGVLILSVGIILSF